MKALATGKTGSGLTYRDIAGSGGYTYRQYEDGTLVILTSPKGGAGTTIYPSNPAWAAITKEIGPYPGTVNPKTGQKWTAQDWALIFTTSANAASAALRESAKKGRKARKAPELPPPPVEAAPAESALPAPVMIAGGVGLAAILLVVLLRSSSGKGER